MTLSEQTYWAEHAWLNGTVEPGVVIACGRSGLITRVDTDVPEPPAGAVPLPGLTLPGLANAHSHVFHRALRGLPAERIDDFLPHWLGHAELMSKAPGFRNNRLHRAVAPDTRFQLVGIAHWDSVEAWRAADNDPRFRHPLSASPGFANANPALFRVAAAF